MQKFSFEKFIKDITTREKDNQEKSKDYAKNHSESPRREYNKLYRERWQNRIKWNRR